MKIEVNNKMKPEDLNKLLSTKVPNRKKINLKKYFGKVKFNIDGLAYQKMVRNEWK